MMTVHPSLTTDKLMRVVTAAMKNDLFPGFCITCGRKSPNPCEPDARGYPCRQCQTPTVYGAEELLFIVAR